MRFSCIFFTKHERRDYGIRVRVSCVHLKPGSHLAVKFITTTCPTRCLAVDTLRRQAGGVTGDPSSAAAVAAEAPVSVGAVVAGEPEEATPTGRALRAASSAAAVIVVVGAVAVPMAAAAPAAAVAAVVLLASPGAWGSGAAIAAEWRARRRRHASSPARLDTCFSAPATAEEKCSNKRGKFHGGGLWVNFAWVSHDYISSPKHETSDTT